jgi:hypothetical protein
MPFVPTQKKGNKQSDLFEPLPKSMILGKSAPGVALAT